MPNSQNRNNNKSNSGKGHAEEVHAKNSAPKANPERSDLKRGGSDSRSEGDTSRTSNQGRKRASGGSADE